VNFMLVVVVVVVVVVCRVYVCVGVCVCVCGAVEELIVAGCWTWLIDRRCDVCVVAVVGRCDGERKFEREGVMHTYIVDTSRQVSRMSPV
jgi:uncharacterized membrane protein YqiK